MNVLYTQTGQTVQTLAGTYMYKQPLPPLLSDLGGGSYTHIHTHTNNIALVRLQQPVK